MREKRGHFPRDKGDVTRDAETVMREKAEKREVEQGIAAQEARGADRHALYALKLADDGSHASRRTDDERLGIAFVLKDGVEEGLLAGRVGAMHRLFLVEKHEAAMALPYECERRVAA